MSLLTFKPQPAMGTSQLLFIVLQLSPLLALVDFHCITNSDEFIAEGWSSTVTVETETDLPLEFQDKMTVDGIIFVRGNGIVSFIEINSPFTLNLQLPVNMYVSYYAHVPVPSGQVVVVTPDLDNGLKNLNMGTDFTWQNASVKIDGADANNNGIAIWFQDAQVGDFLLIDSLIITGGAQLSDEDMIALCSPPTSPPPSSTSTVEFPSSSSSVSPTSTPATGLSSTSSTTESSSASSISQSIPSSIALSSTIDSSSTIRSSESSISSISDSSTAITRSSIAASTTPPLSSSTEPEQSSSSTPGPSHSSSTTDSKSSSSVSSASTDGYFTSELSSSPQSSDRSTLTTLQNSMLTTTTYFYTPGTPDPESPATTTYAVVYPPVSSGGLEDYELVLAVALPLLFLLLLFIMLYYIMTRRRRRQSAVSESELQLYNDASPSAKPSITLSNIDSTDDSVQIKNNNTDFKRLYLPRVSTDAHSRSPSLYRSSIDPVYQSYVTDASRLSLPSGDLLGADLIRRGSTISNLSRASARSTYSGIQEQGWALPRLVRDNN